MSEEIEDRIIKLLRVAQGNANENESQNAMLLAQKLADAHNIEMGALSTGTGGKRADKKLSKGLYKYQRTLYEQMALLNHCKYWFSPAKRQGEKFEIRVLGSKVNVTVTQNLCDYFEDVTNKAVRERFDKKSYFSKDAHAFRHGMVDRLVERMKDRRAEEEATRKREKDEQEARMRHPAAATENAIVLIDDVALRKERLNYDYLNGEGAWDALQARRQEVELHNQKWREERQRRREQEEREQEEANRQYEAWVAANPEEHRRQQEQERREEEKRLTRQRVANELSERARQKRIDRYGYDPKEYRSTPVRTKADISDNPLYWAGQHEANDVGLDSQLDTDTPELLS